MNDLAQVVHDLVTRMPQAPDRLRSKLSPEEHAALEDLRILLTKPPSELAARLVQLGPTANWYSPPRSASSSDQL